MIAGGVATSRRFALYLSEYCSRGRSFEVGKSDEAGVGWINFFTRE